MTDTSAERKLTMEQILEFASRKTGKFLPADISVAEEIVALNYLEQYKGNFFFMESVQKHHSSGKSLSPAQIAGILNTAQREAKDQVKVADIQLEVVSTETPTTYDEIMSRMETLERNIAKMNDSGVPAACRKLISSSAEAEEKLFNDYQKAIEKVRKEKNAAEAELNKFFHDLEDIRGEIDYLKSKEAEFLKAKAAEEKLEEIRATLQEIADNFEWAEKLRPYQWDDICHISAAFLSGKSGVLNANDMGLGKTLETVAMLDILDTLFYQEHGRLPLVLWLTKKSLVGTTFTEFRKWNSKKKIAKLVKVADKAQREMMVEMAITANATIVTNYEALATTPLLAHTEWDVVVCDEVHRLKGGANPTPTQIFTNTKTVAQRAKFFMPLSGSPIVNHPKEMWCYLHIFDSYRFPDVRSFDREFCYGYGEYDEDGNPLVKVDWDRMIEKALKDRVIRRSKAEVLTDLPDKIREFRFLEMDEQPEQYRHYQNLRDKFFTELNADKTEFVSATNIISRLTRLRQCNVLPSGIKIKNEDGTVTQLDCTDSVKLDEAMDIIGELLNSDEQVVVFSSQFNEPMFELNRRIAQSHPKAKVEIVTGDNSSDLEQIQHRFQQNETQVLIINMKTGSEGLNLQKNPEAWPGGASHCIFLDLWYTPATNLQAEDRLHRIGQHDNVTIHILQNENSVDQFIANILEKKDAMINGIMERNELRTGSDWAAMLETMI